MNSDKLSRRHFLKSAGQTVGGTLAAIKLPVILGVAQVACSRRDAEAAFANLDQRQAIEFEAVAAQIIPTDDTPGAREAGVIYFIDGALGSFMAGARDFLLSGLDELHQQAKTLAPSVQWFSELSNQQQIEVLKNSEQTPFFGTMQFLTVAGMFSMPSYGGNKDHVGWQLLGFNHQHVWQPPFGYYDAEYRANNGEVDNV